MGNMPNGAEDGIRTRDPHLGKVVPFVQGVHATALSCPAVYGMSTESARIKPCCRAVYYEIGPLRTLKGERVRPALELRDMRQGIFSYRSNAEAVSVLAVFSALSIASVISRPQRSVRLNSASALMTTARSRRS